METVCQVPFNLMTHAEARKAEAILREYLLRVCDQVTMSKKGSSYLSLFTAWPINFGIKRFKKLLNEEDVASEGEHEWTFNLTQNVKNLFNQSTMFFTGNSKIFYGFTDPKFMSHGNETAYLISNEKFLTLYIPDSDKAQLAAQGVYMDSGEDI